jgi:hypothetical protein
VNGAQGGMKSCKFCGKSIKSDTVVCEYCGYNSQTDSRDPDFKPDKKAQMTAAQGAKSHTQAVKVFFEVLILLVIAVVLIGVIFPGKTIVSAFIPDVRAMLSFGKNSASKQPVSPWPASKTKAKPVSFMKFPAAKKITEKQKFAIEVTGIMFDANGRSFATINGEVVSEGDSIGIYRVNKINSDTVEMQSGSQTIALRVSDTIPLSMSK